MNTNTLNTIGGYPSIQAIKPTADYSKAFKGVKMGRNFMIAGVAIAAGLSNGLSGFDIIAEHTYGLYGGIIAFGIAIVVIGIATIATYAVKSEIKDNPNLVENNNLVSNAYGSKPYGAYGYSAAYYTNPHRV
jgi:hypothetical protein